MGARTRVGAVLAAALLVYASACSQLPPEPVPGEAGWRLRPPGALEPVSLTDPDMLKAVWFAVAEYNKASNNIYVHKMVRVVSAQRQIVSGIKYVLEVEVGKTQCRQGEVDDLDSCALCVHPQLLGDGKKDSNKGYSRAQNRSLAEGRPGKAKGAC